jgi:hypothetical protein
VQEPDGTLVGAILMIGNETAMDVTCGADLYAEVRAILHEKSGKAPA